MDFTTFFRKRIEPFMVVGVIIILLIICLQLKTGLELREEISKNCGWEDEDYRCYCEKTDALRLKSLIDKNFTFTVEGVENVSLVV